MNRARCNSRSAGFTLLEVITAAALAMFLMVLVNQLFNTTTRAVSMGMGTSEVLGKVRAFNSQIARDFSTDATSGYMLLPPVAGLGGALVIVNEEIEAYDNPDDRRLDAGSGARKRWIRSDQILFLRDNGQNSGISSSSPKYYVPACPANNSTFSAYDPAGLTNPQHVVRMWYGHVNQRLDDASSSTNYGGTTTRAGNAAKLGIDDPENPNRYAYQWVLGRQALALTGANPPGEDITFYTTGFGRTSAINGVLGTAWTAAGYTTTPARLYEGLTDVSSASWSDFLNEPSDGLASGGTYVARAKALMYLDNDGDKTLAAYATAPSERLRVLPRPGATLAPIDFAAGHAHFVQGVSDFIVDFAGDYNNDGQLDVVAGGDPDAPTALQIGRIRWYGMRHRTTSAMACKAPLLEVDWDGLGNNSATALASEIRERSTDPDECRNVYVFRNDDNGVDENFNGAKTPGSLTNTQWPWLLRFRYRVHSRTNALGTPYMDREGNVGADIPTASERYPGDSGRDSETGRWFETIVRIQRRL